MNSHRTPIDVLVIGAGPAGSSAARAAALEGARVVLVERRSQVGIPEQCAGYVAQAIRRHVTLPDGCVAQAVDRLRTRLPDGSCHVAEMPGYILRRASLDRDLALRAVQAGASLHLRTAAVDLGSSALSNEPIPCASRAVEEPGRRGWKDSHHPGVALPSPLPGDREGIAVGATHASPACGPHGDGCVRVALRNDGRDLTLDARVVIAADGPVSAVARRLGLGPGPAARAVQYEVIVPRRLEEAEVFFSPAFPGGYAWLFPAGETARVGAAFTSDASSGLAALRHLMKDLQDQGRITGSALAFTSGLVPVGGPGKTRQANVLLAGDAAGHTHPITGAGILNAIISGEIAGRTAARAALSGDHATLDEYEAELDLVLGPALERAREKRVRLDGGWESPPIVLSNRIRESWIAFEEYYAS